MFQGNTSAITVTLLLAATFTEQRVFFSIDNLLAADRAELRLCRCGSSRGSDGRGRQARRLRRVRRQCRGSSAGR